jgi:hypothetical protein
MLENARFCAAVLTDVNEPEKAAQMMPIRSIDLLDLNHCNDTRRVLRAGPKIPTIEEMVQSLYVV